MGGMPSPSRSYALALLLMARPLSAQPAARPSATLNWVRMPGAESCISPQALARAVEERLGRPLLVPLARAEWSLEGRVERRAGQWVATLAASRDDGRSGARTVSVDAPDCAALDPQLVAVVTLLLDPTWTGDAAPSPPPPPSPPTPPTPPPPPPLVAAPMRAIVGPVPPAPRPRRTSLGVGVGFALGWLPAPAPSFRVEAGFAPWGPSARIHASLGATGPLRHSVGAPGVDADFLSLHAELALCLSRPAAQWASLCPGVVVGALHGTAIGSARDLDAWSPAIGVGLRARFEVPLSEGWRLLASLGATLPLLWPRFALASAAGETVSQEIGPEAPVALGAELGVGYALP